MTGAAATMDALLMVVDAACRPSEATMAADWALCAQGEKAVFLAPHGAVLCLPSGPPVHHFHAHFHQGSWDGYLQPFLARLDVTNGGGAANASSLTVRLSTDELFNCSAISPQACIVEVAAAQPLLVLLLLVAPLLVVFMANLKPLLGVGGRPFWQQQGTVRKPVELGR